MENSTVDLRNPIMTEIEDGNNITYRIDIPQKNFQQDTTTQYLQVKKVWENRIKAYIEVLHELGINDELLRSTENLIEDHFEGYANIGIHMPFHRETVRKPHHARALREREYGGTNEQGELDGIRIAVDIDDFLTKMRDVFLETACREIWHVNYHENAYRMNWFGYFNEDADIWEDLGIGRDGYLRAVDVLFKQNGCDDFHENLRPYVDAIEAIRELEEMGAEIIYLTSREDIDQEISGTVCVCDCSGTIVNLKNRMATQRQLDDFGLPEGKLVTKNRENTIGLEEGKNWKAKMVKQLGGFDVIIDDQVANISCTLEELEAMGKKPLGINTDPDLKGNMRFGKVYAGFRIEHKKDIPRLVREWKKIRDRVRIKKREFFSELD